jgi:hypothetical protein
MQVATSQKTGFSLNRSNLIPMHTCICVVYLKRGSASADNLCNVEEHDAAETDCIAVVRVDDPASNVEKQDPSELRRHRHATAPHSNDSNSNSSRNDSETEKDEDGAFLTTRLDIDILITLQKYKIPPHNFSTTVMMIVVIRIHRIMTTNNNNVNRYHPKRNDTKISYENKFWNK